MPAGVAILERVKNFIEQSGGLDLHEMTAGLYYVDAMDPDNSCGYLEFCFCCERELGIRVRFDELLDHRSVSDDGTLTVDSLRRLQQRFPLLETKQWAGRRCRRAIELATVGDIAAIVESEMRRLKAA